MLGDVLLARLTRPDWRAPLCLVFEVEGDASETTLCSNLRPAGFGGLAHTGRVVGRDLAVEQPSIKAGEFAWIRCVNGDGGEL